MSDTATISFRTDPAIKREARELYADMGMDLSTAINIFLRQSIRENVLAGAGSSRGSPWEDNSRDARGSRGVPLLPDR